MVLFVWQVKPGKVFDVLLPDKGEKPHEEQELPWKVVRLVCPADKKAGDHRTREGPT